MTASDFQRRMIDEKASRLLDSGNVKFEGVFGRNARFRILPLTPKNHEHLVFLELDTGVYSCDCKFSSLHPDVECSQIISAKRIWAAMNVIQAQQKT